MIEEGTSDCNKSDIELTTPPSFEFEIIKSSAELNFPFLKSCRYLIKGGLERAEERGLRIGDDVVDPV